MSKNKKPNKTQREKKHNMFDQLITRHPKVTQQVRTSRPPRHISKSNSNSTRNNNTNKTHSTNTTRNTNTTHNTSNVNVGEIGYTLKKYFPGHGVYDGVIVEIRRGAIGGRDRRVLYTDGDSEDMDMKTLETLEPSEMTMSSILKRAQEEKALISSTSILPTTPAKRKRRHPPKKNQDKKKESVSSCVPPAKRKRGRPPIEKQGISAAVPPVKRKRGRPRKTKDTDKKENEEKLNPNTIPTTTSALNKEQKRTLKKHAEDVKNMKKIHDANIERMKTDSADLNNNVTVIFSPPRKTQKKQQMISSAPVLSEGDYVKVVEDSSPGNNRPAGSGYIKDVEKNQNGNILSVSVRYDIDKCLYKNIPLDDTTKSSPPFSGDFGRKRRAATDVSNEQEKKRTKNSEIETNTPEYAQLSALSPIEHLKAILKKGCKKGKGWHRAEYGLNPLYSNKSDKDSTYVHLNEQEKVQLLYEYDLLRQHLEDTQSMKHNKRNKKGQFNNTSKKTNPITLTNLYHVWGIGKQTMSRTRKSKVLRAMKNDLTEHHQFLSIVSQEKVEEETDNTVNVIDSFEVASKTYTTEFLYLKHHMQEWRETVLDSEESNRTSQAKRQEFKNDFKNLNSIELSEWNAKRREILELQPKIKGIILDVLRKNNSISYVCLSGSINSWCSAQTLQRWVTSREGYEMYSERIIPHLSFAQKNSHKSFALKFRNNWGLGGGKFLLLHYDEKWFWGLLLRKTAKTFDDYIEALKKAGMNEKEIRAYHKSHVSKTMGVAMVGFAFIDSIENGGEAVKLEFTRAQSAKVAGRQVSSSDGKIIRSKGDIFWRDCAVTGSSEGSSNDPKFPLVNWFKYLVFPKIEKLVGEGGMYEGFTPIIQGDNAGPHRDTTFYKYVTEHCNGKGWYWEPQAAQMPHMNVNDLAVFPSMSRNHATELRSRGGIRVMKEDEIWNAAESVWRDMPSCDIGRSFVLAHRIAEKVISMDGDNIFLTGKKGGLHADVRKDFIDTPKGIKRRDNKTMKAPARTLPLPDDIENI